MVQWWSPNQDEVDCLWKELRGKREKEVPEKYKVEEANKGRIQRTW